MGKSFESRLYTNLYCHYSVLLLISFDHCKGSLQFYFEKNFLSQETKEHMHIQTHCIAYTFNRVNCENNPKFRHVNVLAL